MDFCSPISICGNWHCDYTEPGQRSGLSSSSFRTKMEQSTSITKRLIFEEDVNTPVDINVCHRRMEELAKLPSHFKDLEEEAMAVAKLEIFSDSYLLGLEELILEMKSEYIDLAGEENGLESIGNDDLDSCLENLKKELHGVQVEAAQTSQEIEIQVATAAKDAKYLSDALLALETYLMSICPKKKQLEQLKSEEVNWDEDKWRECCMLRGENNKFEVSKLTDQLNQKRADWRDLQNLDDMFKRVEAIKKVEDMLYDIEVVSVIDNCIKLSMKTCVPALGGSVCQFKIDCIKEACTFQHELLIKVAPETMALQDAELTPNDVPIDDIVNIAKTLRDSISLLMSLNFKNQLQYLVREIQHRIYYHTIRLAVLKEDAKISRNSFEYSERDQVITVHMFGGIKAFIKLPQEWPVSTSPLKLLSLKPLTESSSDISLTVLCKAMEILNSLELSRRCNLLHFIDAVEEILVQQMQKGACSGRMLY